MAAKAADAGVKFRPHFKTHQSAEVGCWFREAGVDSITVSSVSMAEYFAGNGWSDITIAFPVNIHEIDEINELAGKIDLNLLIESAETAEFLSQNLLHPCNFLIKIDTGYHRTGIESKNTVFIDALLKSADPGKLKFKGFLTHSGNSYHAETKEELMRINESTASQLNRLRKKYLSAYPALLISVGDTPICSQLPIQPGIDEIRPGNFVFYDLMQFSLGSCKLDEIALAVVCPVVSVHASRQEAVVYCGAVHLSKEHIRFFPDPEPVYGVAVSWDGENFNTDELLGKVKSLSQEHGILKLTQAGCNLKPGHFVAIIPVHSCLVVSQMKSYTLQNGKKIECFGYNPTA